MTSPTPRPGDAMRAELPKLAGQAMAGAVDAVSYALDTLRRCVEAGCSFPTEKEIPVFAGMIDKLIRPHLSPPVPTPAETPQPAGWRLGDGA